MQSLAEEKASLYIYRGVNKQRSVRENDFVGINIPQQGMYECTALGVSMHTLSRRKIAPFVGDSMRDRSRRGVYGYSDSRSRSH